MVISNAEKQARFRKKEELKKYVAQAFREAQMMFGFKIQEDPQVILARLEEAASLPTGWTDDDYERAKKKLQTVWLDLRNWQDELANDVNEPRFHKKELLTAPDPMEFFTGSKDALKNTRALASHLISAIDLSSLDEADRAAAVMEAVRHAGKALANSSDVGRSSGNAVCLASLPSYYDRPDWFLEALSNWLAWRLGEGRARELGRRLVEFDYGV